MTTGQLWEEGSVLAVHVIPFVDVAATAELPDELPEIATKIPLP